MTKSKRKPERDKRDQPTVAPIRHPDALILILLAIATVAVFGSVWNYEFVSYSDPEYVATNPVVGAGVTAAGTEWALTSFRVGKWFPLSWLSHMVDCQLFGLRSGLHHIMNLLLHLGGVLLLFTLLRRMTGNRWRSALVAFLFALHPLHVEAVAWVAQRKEILSAIFWFATIWAYLRYVERPQLGRYLLLIILFCLGLMSGPTVIALPVVLVLLDVWPLRRIRMAEPEGAGKAMKQEKSGREWKSFPGILLEKAVLFELSAATAVVTAVFQKPAASIMPQEFFPIGTRLANALTSAVVYIRQTLWPAGLAVAYPHASPPPAWQAIGSGLALAGISFLALRLIRRFPYIAVGWFWYLAALAPAIGSVLAGAEPQADRYTYIPLIGLFLVLSWGVADAFARRQNRKPVMVFVSSAVCAVCLLLSWNQVQHWRNSESLFRHALDVAGGSYIGYYGLAGTLRDQGRDQEAVLPFAEAIRLAPGDAKAYGELADIFLKQEKINEAITLYREAVRLNPNSRQDRIRLGIALTRAGKAADSIEQLAEAIKTDPGSVEARYNLGQAYAAAGQFMEAATQFTEVIRLQPDNVEAHYNLGTSLARQDKMIEAVAEFEQAIKLKPGYANAHNNLGSALANLGRIDEAVAHFSEAVRLAPDSEDARRNLQYGLTIQGRPVKR